MANLKDQATIPWPGHAYSLQFEPNYRASPAFDNVESFIAWFHWFEQSCVVAHVPQGWREKHRGVGKSISEEYVKGRVNPPSLKGKQ